MKKFNCGCGRAVRDVYYKNGACMCGKCFWQGSDSPYDYVINMLAARGFVITYKDAPVLVIKQFSADDDMATAIRPSDDWVVVSGDDFWANYSGDIENLRDYITTYGQKKDEGCSAKED